MEHTQSHGVTGSTIPLPVWAICVAGGAGLAAAMGIGRFAFTPLLPLMQKDGVISGASGSWLAAANYMGYLIGALTAARLPGTPRQLLTISLLATAVLTASMAMVGRTCTWLSADLGACDLVSLMLGCALRGFAGVASAWSLVVVSGWAVGALARVGRPGAAGWVFAGVGVGIATAGTWVWWRAEDGVALLWAELGAGALVVTAVVWWLTRHDQVQHAVPSAALNRSTSDSRSHTALRHGWPLVICYGSLGLGYILPATYLPSLARLLVDDPARFGLVWPVFGAAAAASTLVASRAMRRWRGRCIWAVSHSLMAIGCLMPVMGQSVWTISVSALLVGGTFMVATMTGLQEARSLMPEDPRPLLARMTAAFATGQIGGPLLVLAATSLLPVSVHPMNASLLLASACLAASTCWLFFKEQIVDLD